MTAEATVGSAASSEPSPVLIEDSGLVRVITLNRPEARNAIDLRTARAIEAAVDEFEACAQLSVMVIAANGPAFCAGMDLKAFLRGERASTEDRGFAGLVRRPPTKPLIAAVEAPAVAGGFEIVLACDLVVASRAARFGLPEVKRGLTAAGGGLMRLPSRLPLHLALEIALTGETITAQRADELGLLNRLTAPGEALSEALKLARQIAANAPLALAASKQIMLRSPNWLPAEAFARQDEFAEPVRRSDDAQEGARAFVEHRPPRWSGA